MSADQNQIPLSADPGEALKKFGGEYKDNAAEGNDQMSRLPQVAMPTGTDPKPFTIKGGTP